MTDPVSSGGTERWAIDALVGRDELLADLVAGARAAATGTGSVYLLTGEAGIGKTSVVRTLARQMKNDLAVTWGSCLADQGAPPFWPWRELVRAEPAAAAEAGEAIGAPRFERLTLLREQIQAQAKAQPRLHLIEDLQWADVASVLLLTHLATAVPDTPIQVVATLRTGEPRSSQLEEALEELRRSSRVIDLQALTEHDIAALIRGAGAEPEERFVTLLRARTGGNPLFVSELLRSIPLGDSAQLRLAAMTESIPPRVSDLTRHRLSRLPAAVAEALITASVIGTDGDVSTLANAHGSDPVGVLELLDQARAAHLLDSTASGRWRFRHQLIRDAVYASLAASNRAERHARVVEALAADPSTAPPTIALHALAALPIFDADRAVALAARAGDVALSHRAYEEAVGWFTRALAAAPPETAGRWRAELLVLCGEAYRQIGDVGAARDAFVRASEITDDPSLLARAALGYADQGADLGIAYRSDGDATVRLLERAMAAQPPEPSVTSVQLQARLAAELYFSDEPQRPRPLAFAALEQARRLGDARALGVATAVVHDAFVIGQCSLDAQLHESNQLLAWARTTGSMSALLTAHRASVFDQLAAGDMAAVDGQVLAFRRLAEPLRAPGYLWWPALWSAMRALLEGRHDEAERRAVAAYEIGAAPFPTLSFVNLSFFLFFLRREQGRLAEMEQGTRDYAASHADVPAIRVGLAFLLAELGRLDEARGALAAFDQSLIAQLHDRNWPASWFQLARVVALVGDRDLAAVLLDPHGRPSERCVQVSLGTVCLGATDLAAAWLLHTVGDLDAADTHFRSAADLNARIGARSWLAQTRADHARMLVERDAADDCAQAAHLMDLAQTAAREIGLATVVAPQHASPSPQTTARFRRDGHVWEVAFAGRTARISDGQGMRDIRHLLARQGEAISVVELASADGSISSITRGAPAFDERARRQIRQRLHELDEEESEADAMGDAERAAIVREQRRELAEAVSRDFGLGARPRRIGDPAERARKTVSTRIRRTIAAIGRVHPELGRHLERSIDTGAWCAYRPADRVEWLT